MVHEEVIYCARQVSPEEQELFNAEQLWEDEQRFKALLCKFGGSNSSGRKRKDESKIKRLRVSVRYILE